MNKPLFLAWIAAIVATLGSLYFSEIRHFTPCTLCWYQRILMYPLTIFIGVALYENNIKIHKYILPIAILGMFVSGYHYSLQKIPALSEIQTCTNGVPCGREYVNFLGFITIPFMAFIAFTIIAISMFTMKKVS